MAEDIHIVHCAISEVGKRLKSTLANQLFIVCDRNVRNLAEKIGIESDGVFEIDATEDTKDISTVVEIDRWLMDKGADLVNGFHQRVLFHGGYHSFSVRAADGRSGVKDGYHACVRFIADEAAGALAKLDNHLRDRVALHEFMGGIAVSLFLFLFSVLFSLPYLNEQMEEKSAFSPMNSAWKEGSSLILAPRPAVSDSWSKYAPPMVERSELKEMYPQIGPHRPAP